MAVARFGGGEPAASFRALADETRGLDDPPPIAVAEDHDALARLWRQYDLSGAPPGVDFTRELVLAFAEPGFCNDAQLTGFALTSAGELIPRVRASGMVCNVISRGDCPLVRVHVAALGRSAFPAETYTLGWYGALPFVVRSPGSSLAPAAPARLPPPSGVPRPRLGGPAGTRPAHRRRALIVEASGGEHASLASERVGVWVRADAVWTPEPPPRSTGDRSAIDEEPAESVCDAEACARVLTRSMCDRPACPARGILLFAESPLGVREPWPTEAAAWERLVGDLAADPELGVIIGRPQPFPRPEPARAPADGWARYRFGRGIELAASADYQRASTGEGFLGPGVRLGWHRNWAVQDTTTQGKIFEPLVGDGWGLDLRVGALRSLSGAPSPGTGLRAGLGLSATNAVGLSTSTSRVRVASLLGLLLPELGMARLPGESPRFSTTNALPVAWLISSRLALEARPALSVLFGAGAPHAMLSISFGLMWRTRESICPDPPLPSGANDLACARTQASFWAGRSP